MSTILYIYQINCNIMYSMYVSIKIVILYITHVLSYGMATLFKIKSNSEQIQNS